MSKRFVVVRRRQQTMMATLGLWLGISTVVLQLTLAQTYFLALGEHPTNFLSATELRTEEPYYEYERRQLEQEYLLNQSRSYKDFENELNTLNDLVDKAKQNSTIVLVQQISHKKRPEIPQTTMDVITVVWYVATFLALATFFLLMACTDRSRRRAEAESRARETTEAATTVPPLTPTPSYSEFAPPSYEAVMKMEQAAKSAGIYVLPLPLETVGGDAALKNDSGEGGALPVVDFYIVNESLKEGS